MKKKIAFALAAVIALSTLAACESSVVTGFAKASVSDAEYQNLHTEATITLTTSNKDEWYSLDALVNDSVSSFMNEMFTGKTSDALPKNVNLKVDLVAENYGNVSHVQAFVYKNATDKDELIDVYYNAAKQTVYFGSAIFNKVVDSGIGYLTPDVDLTVTKPYIVFTDKDELPSSTAVTELADQTIKYGELVQSVATLLAKKGATSFAKYDSLLKYDSDTRTYTVSSDTKTLISFILDSAKLVKSNQNGVWNAYAKVFPKEATAKEKEYFIADLDETIKDLTALKASASSLPTGSVTYTLRASGAGEQFSKKTTEKISFTKAQLKKVDDLKGTEFADYATYLKSLDKLELTSTSTVKLQLKEISLPSKSKCINVNEIYEKVFPSAPVTTPTAKSA